MAQRLDGSQAILNSSAFDAYGVESATSTPSDPFGYNAQSGYLLDRDTGLYLCQHRYYDATTGRWITRDPIGYEGGTNLYGYARQDPIGEVDVDGFDAQGRIWRAIVFSVGPKAYRSLYLLKNGKMPTTITKQGNVAEYSSDCGRFTHAVVGSDDPSYPVVGTPDMMTHVRSNPKWQWGFMKKGGYQAGDILLRNGHVGVLLGFEDSRTTKKIKGKSVTVVHRTYFLAQASLGDHDPELTHTMRMGFTVFARPKD